MTNEQQAKIDKLYDGIKDYGVPMAVVDFLGTMDSQFNGSITADDPDRFGTRSLRDVMSYGFKVVKLNRVALEKGYGG